MFTVVTDSSVYFTRKEAESLGVRMLPLLYSVNGQHFGEGYADENGRFLQLVEQGQDMYTAQVSTSTFLSTFSELRRKKKDILCLTMSSRLSGVYSSAMMTARDMDPEHIIVVDSLSIAGGFKFLAEKACEMARQNYTLQQAADEIESMRDRIGIVFSVNDMGALRRSGRLGFVRQSVTTMLNLRPILLCKYGAVVSDAVARGTHAQIRALVRTVPDGAKRIEVQYVQNRQSAEVITEELKRRFACLIEISNVGPVLAIHLGLSAIGISWQS